MHRNLNKTGNILKQEGTSRYERYLPALDPASVQIDGRKLQDLIVYVQRYSQNLLFVDTEAGHVNLHDSWEYFFGNDNIVMLIAGIATKNVEELKDTYDAIHLRFTRLQTHEQFRELLDYVFAKFRKVNTWYYSISQDNSLKADLVLYIQSYLQKELESLKEIIFYIRDRGNNNYSHNDFLKEFYGTENLAHIHTLLNRDDVWEIGKKENIPLREQIFAGGSEEEKLNSAALTLNKIFDAVFYATGNLINNCKRYFEETIHRKEDHPPHIAFLITFVKLYGYLQEELNKIPLRHLEYYYKEILHVKAKAAIPDQAFVVFELAKGFDTCKLKKGTPLAAGKDMQKADLVYHTDDDIVINKARVTSVQTVFIDRDQQNQTLNYYKAAILEGGTQPAPSDTEAFYKTFGEPDLYSVAETGFGIASTQFYLEKGERNVVITFKLQDDTALDQYDTGIIKLLLTGEKGWLNSDDKKSGITIVSLKKAGSQIVELSFTISIAQESAIVPFNSKIHEGNFNSPFPVLQCIMKYPLVKAAVNEQEVNEWKNSIAQINSLQKLHIAAASIRVQVGSIQTLASFDGIKDLLVENSEAPLDSKKPFYPFTSIPKPGSSFYIGCKDLFYKTIQRLSVNIEWMLPNDFDSYYSKYLPPYDANRFRASLSILQGKHWKKLNEISVIDKNAGDPRFKVIKIDFDKLKTDQAPGLPENTVTTFDNEKKDGTLKLKLKYPDFGHGIYPQLITSAVMEKAASTTSAVNYHKIVLKQLGDSVISVKLPPDINQRNGSLKVVYDILDREKDDNRATEMINSILSKKIEDYNGSNPVIGIPAPSPAGEEQEGRRLVNDENFVERVLRFLKKVKIIDTRIHYDEDKQNADQVVNAVKDKIKVSADFMMPSDREMVNVIMYETNSAISKTVSNVIEEIITLRTKGVPDPGTVAGLLQKEFDEANQVINDMIAHKIAILLSANEIPPPPYTPLINAISLSYSSVKASGLDDRFFHLTPLGVFEIDIFNGAGEETTEAAAAPLLTASLFPGAIVQNPKTSVDVQGMLFIGIQQVKPGRNVTFLVKIAEGTKKNDKKPPAVNWWYLRNYTWVKLNDDDLVSDTTYGLQTTGIVEISIPAGANDESVIFNTPSLFWLCAGVTDQTDAFPKLFSISSQVVTATFKDQGNDPAHLSLPLEARQINGFVETIPQIKKVSQPVSSYGGQVEEQGQEYYTRVSERLRHKNRAISNWDYERLVLENFPSLFKVKCLNNYYNGRFAAGHVTVVPIANLTNKSYEGNNLLIPRTSYIDLMRIEKFLQKKTSPFIRIHAVNPQLDHVLIHCKVKFHTGADKGFYLQQLNDELISFLTPWASGDSAELSFSAKIYSSSIVNFIDRKEYVEYVTDVVMEQYTENDLGEKDFCTEEDELTSLVETRITTGHSILVSAPKHEIELVE